jgi:hypothetical protein
VSAAPSSWLSTVQPSIRNSFPIVRTSASCGTLRNVDAPLGRSAAASSGSAAFFAPLTGILPVSRAPPSTTILSMSAPTDVSRNVLRSKNAAASPTIRSQTRVLGALTDPPAHTFDPPAYTFDPPAHTFDPPAHTFDPPAYTFDPPAYTFDPPAYTFDPPAYMFDPPAYTFDPPGLRSTRWRALPGVLGQCSRCLARCSRSVRNR